MNDKLTQSCGLHVFACILLTPDSPKCPIAGGHLQGQRVPGTLPLVSPCVAVQQFAGQRVQSWHHLQVRQLQWLRQRSGRAVAAGDQLQGGGNTLGVGCSKIHSCRTRNPMAMQVPSNWGSTPATVALGWAYGAALCPPTHFSQPKHSLETHFAVALTHATKAQASTYVGYPPRTLVRQIAIILVQ